MTQQDGIDPAPRRTVPYGTFSLSTEERDNMVSAAFPFVESEDRFVAQTMVGSVQAVSGGLRYGIRKEDGSTVVLTESFEGAENRKPEPGKPAATKVSIFKGSDPARWKAGLSTYSSAEYAETWPGISLSVVAHGTTVEKVFTVEPKADPSAIAILVKEGAPVIQKDGSLQLLSFPDIRLSPPIAYQEIDGIRRSIEVAYAVDGNRYGFSVGEYDRNHPLIIDPAVYGTYFGGTLDDYAFSLHRNASSGRIYICGDTSTADPATFIAGAPGYDQTKADSNDGYVAVFDSTLAHLLGFTYLAGDGYDTMLDVTSDATGNVFVVGAGNANMPYLNGPYTYSSGRDGFIAKLNADLTELLVSSYVTGTSDDSIRAIALDSTGAPYVIGHTSSSNFITVGAVYDTTLSSQDGFVQKWSADLSSLTLSTLIGGTSTEYLFDVRVDTASDTVYVVGYSSSTNFPVTAGAYQLTNAGGAGSNDVVVFKMNSSLSSLLASTYFGGTGHDYARQIALDTSGNVFFVGYANSATGIATSGTYNPSFHTGTDGYVAKFSNDLTQRLAATYVGGAGTGDEMTNIAIGTNNDVYVTGTISGSSGAPSGGIGMDTSYNDGNNDGWVGRFSNDLATLKGHTYFVYTQSDRMYGIALDSFNNAYVAGHTNGAYGATIMPTGGFDTSHSGGGDASVLILHSTLVSSDVLCAGDCDVPTASSFSPADNATGVSATATFSITFSEAISAGAGNIVIKKASDNSVIETIAASAVSGLGTTTMTVDPSVTLADGTAYYITIDATAFKDAANNYYAGISSSSTWNFTTYDSVGPSATAFSPADNATGVSYTANLVITFNKVTRSGPGTLTIKKTSDNSTIETISVSGALLSGNGSTQLTLNPSTTLVQTTEYYVLWTADAFKNVDGFYAAAQESTTIWSFTTGDTTVPTASTLSPADNATEIALDADLGITFSETVQAGAGNVVIKKTSDNSTIETIAASAASGLGTATITMNPSVTLLPNTAYYVQVGSTAFRDASNNYYDGISNTTSWNFTTTDNVPPTVSTLSPADNATGVSTTANLILTFDMATRAGTGTLTIKKTSDNSTVETIAVSGALLSGNGTTQLTLNPVTTLAESTEHYVVWTANAFKRATGQHAAAQTSTTSWSFRTTEPAPPSVGSLSPADNATGVSTTANLVLTFDEATRAGTGTLTIRKTSNDSVVQTIAVSGALLSGNGTTQLTLNPSVTLAESTEYYVVWSANAFKSANGLHTAAQTSTTSWSFTTTGTWLSGYSYRKLITVQNTNIDANLANVPTLVYLSDSDIGGALQDTATCFDVRFTDSDGTTLLPFEREKCTVAGGTVTANFWVKIPNLYQTPTGSQNTIYVYYGKAGDTDGQDAATTWSDYLLVWHAGNGSTLSLTDSTGKHTLTNSAVSAAAGPVSYLGGAALSTNQYITIGGNTSDLAIDNTSWGMSAFINESSSCPYASSIVMFGNNGLVNEDAGPSNSVGVVYNNSFSKDVSINHSTWYYFTGQHTAANALTYYLNGIPQALVSTSDAGYAHAGLYHIGKGYAYYKGSLGEIRAYSGVKTDAWVKFEYHNMADTGNNVTLDPQEAFPSDTDVPTVSTLSPADNATGVSASANLVLTFSENVTAQAGKNIVIYKAVDDSVFESIAATDAKVSVNDGTVTINPSGSFSTAGMGYYVQIDAGAFNDAAENAYAGIADAATWSFTSADVSVPALSSIAASPTNTSATITWTTDEVSSSQVQYGTTTSFGSLTAETDTSPRILSPHTVALSSLPSCTTYFYRVISRDASLNAVTGSTASFTTTGCAASAPVGSQTGATVPTSGGSLSMTNGGSGAALTVPADATTNTFTLQIKKLDTDTVTTSIDPPSGTAVIGDHTYDIRAISGSLLVTTFAQPITITMEYTDEQVSGYDEATLKIYRWDSISGVWSPLDPCTVYADLNQVECTTTHFSTFGLFGESVAEDDGGDSSDDGSASMTRGVGGRRGSKNDMAVRIASAQRAVLARFEVNRQRSVEIAVKAQEQMADDEQVNRRVAKMLERIAQRKARIAAIETTRKAFEEQYAQHLEERIAKAALQEAQKLAAERLALEAEQLALQEEQEAMAARRAERAERLRAAAGERTSVPLSLEEIAARRDRLYAIVDESPVLYTDVPLSSWYAPYVAALVEEKIATGYADAMGKPTGQFGVENPVTYAEILKMAFVAANTADPALPPPRNVSAQGTWAASFVAQAEALNLSVFSPSLDVQKPATRGAVIQTILEVMKFPTGIKIAAPFSDVPSDHIHAQAIATAAAYGLITGDTDADGNALGIFRPDAPITRAETAKIIALVKEALQSTH